MIISGINQNYTPPQFGNLSYSKQSGLRSMQHIKGYEREVVKMYKNELTHDIWGNVEKLKEWAIKKVEEIATREYPSKYLDSYTLREGRTDLVDRWYQLVKSDVNTSDNPFLQIKIMRFVTEKLLTDNKLFAPIINNTIFTQTAYEVKKTGKSFKKTYNTKMREFDSKLDVTTEYVSVNGVTGRWYNIHIPDSIELNKNIGKLKQLQNYVAILSQGSNWCTRSPHTVGKEFIGYDFNIFIDNKGIPQLCLASIDKNKKWFKHISGCNQYAPIEDKYKQVLKAFIEKHELTNAVYGEPERNKPIQELFNQA